MNLTFLIATILILFSTDSSGQTESSVRCPLLWKLISNGDPLPSNSVATDEGKAYIVRRESIVGAYSLEDNEAYFASESTELNSTASTHFEILTNPHECILEWKPYLNGQVPDKFAIPVGTSFVGRGINLEECDFYYAGAVVPSSGGLVVAFYAESVPQFLKSYDVLVAYSSGLLLEMVDFVFNTDPFGSGGEFLGSDFITNDSPATIRQSLTHRKKITETTSITTNRTWTSTYTETFKIWLIFFTYKKTKVTKYEHSTSETVETTEITEVAVTRDLVVPPFSSIQACSVVSIKEAEKIEYRATARYSAPGLLSAEVQEILQDGGITNGKIDGDYVTLEASGDFTAKLAMNTKFFVKNAGSAEDCDYMKFTLDHANK